MGKNDKSTSNQEESQVDGKTKTGKKRKRHSEVGDVLEMEEKRRKKSKKKHIEATDSEEGVNDDEMIEKKVEKLKSHSTVSNTFEKEEKRHKKSKKKDKEVAGSEVGVNDDEMIDKKVKKMKSHSKVGDTFEREEKRRKKSKKKDKEIAGSEEGVNDDEMIEKKVQKMKSRSKVGDAFEKEEKRRKKSKKKDKEIASSEEGINDGEMIEKKVKKRKKDSKPSKDTISTLPKELDPLILSLLKKFYVFIHTESIAGFGTNGRVFFPEGEGADPHSLWRQIYDLNYDNWIQRILDLDEDDPLKRAFKRKNADGRKLYKENFHGAFRFIRNYLEHVHTIIEKMNNARKRANKGEPEIPNISRDDMILNLLKIFPDFFQIIFRMYQLPEEIMDLTQHLRLP